MRKLKMDKVKMNGDVPSPRFGHSFTMVSKTKAVLFGGAVSVGGKFIITNEAYLYDFPTNNWKALKFNPQGNIPCERAAHAATMVGDMQMVIYGGAASTAQNMLRDQLYLLDLRREPHWKIIDTRQNKGGSPGQRYGHSMIFNNPYLIIFGGNSGNKAQNDIWLLNISRGPFTWQKYQFQNTRMPCPRVYHSAALCQEGKAQGMMVVYGGRRQTKKDQNNSSARDSNVALNDIWGLVRHRNGVWDWATPQPSDEYNPIGRFQHMVCFMGSKLVIVGGRTNDPEERVSSIQVYDTETAEWEKSGSISRYRHAVVLQGQKLFIHGGFEPQYISQPLETMTCIDLKGFEMKKPLTQQNQFTKTSPNMNFQKEREIQEKEPKELKQITNERELYPRTGLRQINESERNISNNSRIRNTMEKSRAERDLTPSRIINSAKNPRLNNQVVVAKGDTLQIQRVPVNALMEESKKLNNQPDDFSGDLTLLQLTDNVLAMLMPKNGVSKLNGSNFFPFKKDKVYRLCQETSKILSNETSLVGSRAPVKIFGSIYGRYAEILRFFENFGYPDERQMQVFQYIFLGNYVDKSLNSLETICLLMALKIKYPDHIHLLRGKHEDININKVCGLGQQCSIRLGQNIQDPESVFHALNKMFDFLPLAAAVQDQFLCINSGVGRISDLTELKNLERPVKVKDSPALIDMFWSEKGNHEGLGYKGKGYSEEELQIFLQDNNLQMFINTKDGLQNGIEEGKSTLSVFSVSNYSKGNNKAGILRVNKDLNVVPYIIKGSSNKINWVGENNFKINQNFSETEMEFRKTMFQITN